MCGVVGDVVFLADAGVVGVADGVEAGWTADGCDARVRSFGVEVGRRQTLALVGRDTLAPNAARAADWSTDVLFAVVLPAVAADRVVRPS